MTQKAGATVRCPRFFLFVQSVFLPPLGQLLRIPVIPGVNDGRQNIEASADFILRQLGGQVRTLQLLSFMRLGEEKYKSLGIPYQMEAVRLQRRAFQRRVEEIARYFNSRGIHCLVGTKEKEESQPE